MSEHGFRLSPQQERIWLLQPGGSDLRAQCLVELEGPLDVAALEAAARALSARHEILHTRFVRPAGLRVPLQVIDAEPWLDWRRSDVDRGDPAVVALALWEAERRRSFAFEDRGLLRVTLARLSDQRHVLVAGLPALCSDARGLAQWCAALADSYAADGAGEADDVVQFVDLAEWERELLDEPGAPSGPGRGLERWGTLAAESFTRLPTMVSPSGASRPWSPQHSELDLAPGTGAAVDALARACAATAGDVLHAAWQTLTWRLAGGDEVVTGVVAAARGDAQLDAAIGPLARALPARTRLASSLCFTDVVRSVARAREQLEPWQHHFAWPERAPGEPPSHFSLGFQYDALPQPRTARGVRFTLGRLHARSDHFDAALCCGARGASLTATLDYDAGALERDEADRLGARYGALLDDALARPDTIIGRLAVLGADERRRLLVELNEERSPGVEPEPVHRQFERQVARAPERPALVFEGEALSYAQLDARAEAVAQRLRAVGVAPESFVGLFAERSAALVVGILGIWKAGAAYVALDPVLPGERLRGLLRDCAAEAVVVQDRVRDALPAPDAPVIALDAVGKEAGTSGASASTPPVAPVAVRGANVAYAMFTSGSTGAPKGVLVEHRQLARYVAAIGERLALPEGAHFATVSTFAADLGHTVVFPALCAGGCLHVVSDERLLDPAALADYCERHPIDCLKIVPSHLAALMRSPRAKELLPRQRLVLGGEASSWELVRRVHEQAPDCLVWNHYGPTETTVGALACSLPASSPADAGSGSQAEARAGGGPPLGRPLAGARVYVLDGYLEPVPIGVPGELYIAGEGVARGYLRRPDLTAERFLPDPFDARPGERMYRTGDRARVSAAGAVEFLGRLDHQVKLRGFRIELGEIEAALEQLDAVREAVVVAREDPGVERRLVAYLRVRDAAGLDPAPLREALRRTLPEQMVPAAFVALERFPLNRNGKLDRAALPPPEPEARDRDRTPPRDEREGVLAELWAELLGVPEVGIHDDFFALGGHSLLAMLVTSRIRETFGVMLSLRRIFEAPTVAGLARAVEQAEHEAPADAGPPLQAVAREADTLLPLSFAQQQLWFLDQLEPDRATYNRPIAVRVRGSLDAAALELALAEVVRRHEVLRTRYPSQGGRPAQRVEAHVEVALPVVDLRGLGEAVERVAASLLAAEARTPFDLARGPVIRCRLLRAGAADHWLLVTLHHIASDAWSTGVLVRELSASYDAATRGRASALEPLPLQYADYAAWQRAWLEAGELARQTDYWRERLSGAPPLLELPTDRARPPRQSFRGATLPVAIGRSLTDGLHALSRAHGATLFMTLLAAFSALLGRHARTTDVSVGTPVAGRGRVELEPLIGFFVNTLVMRSDLSGDPGFDALLARVRENVLEDFARPDLPFERLVDALQPERELSRSPLFQVMLILQNAPMPELELGPLRLAPAEPDSGTAKFDLLLNLVETERGLEGFAEFSTDLFDAATVERWLGHFENLLRAVVAEPAQPVSRMTLIGVGEQRRLRDYGGGAARSASEGESLEEGACLHERFEARARLAPQAVAVSCGGEQLTYAQLDARANRLAVELCRRGAGPEELVALCCGRSVELVVGMLGILKAGAAYLPLDPDLPAARLAYILQDSGAALVVTQRDRVASLPPCDARLVLLDESDDGDDGDDLEDRAAPATAAPLGAASPDNVAYVIYTSGSTGRPKGTAVTHRNVTRLLAASQPRYGFDDGDCWTLFHSYAFDFSVWEIWGALLFGGRLVVVPFDVARSPSAFAELLRREGVTILNQTPSAFRQLMAAESAAAEAAGALRLRLVVFGGEALEVGALAPWFARHGADTPRLVNMYGITETTVHVTEQDIAPETATPHGSPIGRPIGGVQVHLLDAHLNPVPLGVAGELCVGGSGLARGYLHRPGLTAERFVPHPFPEVPGERLYRSGDLARWLPGGTLEYLGRIDHQVKIRGYRIELGEIEAALAELPSVREAAVLAREDASAARLVAYLSSDGERPSIAALREALAARLPSYMIPATFVLLDTLPLTPNGKVDRAALPAPEHTRPALEAEFVAPRTASERTLAAIWAEVLALDAVGVHDNFFEVGGDSILAIQIVARARAAGLPLTPRDVFEHQTVLELALRGAALAAGDDAGAGASAAPIASADRTGPTPLSFAQERLWLLDQIQPDSEGYNIPFALHVSGGVDVTALESALAAIVERHASLRTTYAERGGEVVQRVGAPAGSGLGVVDLRQLDASARAAVSDALAAAETRRRFDLGRGPLLRAVLLRLAETEHVFLLTMHQIATDHWSLAVFARELAQGYAAFSRGDLPQLPALPIQYADFAAWQRGTHTQGLLDAQLAWWKESLAGAPAALELPTDRARPRVQTFRGGVESLALGPALSRAVRECSRRERVTPFMTLLAAFYGLLQRHSGQRDIVIGVPTAGRTRAETEGLIGFFLNTLALRVDLGGDPSFRELLGRVRDVSVGAFANQDVPFERVVEALQPERDASRPLLFQVMFNMHNTPNEPVSLAGLRGEEIHRDDPASLFDLTLYAVEEPLERDADAAGEARDELRLWMVYNADLFEADTVRQLLDHLEGLLRRCTDDPERKPSAVRLLAVSEREKTHQAPPRSAEAAESIPARFARCVAEHPDAPAVVAGEDRWSYRELDARAADIAHAVAARAGGGPLTALLFDPGAAQIAALLGVLKAGRGYVPLDPAHPPERLAAILADCDARGIVTDRHRRALAESLAAKGLAVIDVDALARSPRVTPLPAVRPESVAYVLYTSGSTGRPKGVFQAHRAVVHFGRVYARSIGLQAGQRVLGVASYAFDAAVMDIFGALLAGATLQLCDLRAEGLAALDRQLADGVEIFHATPSVFRALLAAAALDRRFDAVRVVVLGGEEALATDLAAFRRHFGPACRLVNGLGPTESTLGLQHQLDAGAVETRTALPVGRPVEGVRALLLDPEGRDAEVFGEIALRSEHVALGYWGRPDLTAAAFLPDPDGGPTRIYRTGDLGRRLPDGRFAFLGRVDDQVKVRGFRVELGEIEAALCDHAAIAECAVVARNDGAGGLRLAGYAVPVAGGGAAETPDEDVLRSHLAARLPSHMVPASIQLLAELPRTPNGKLDKRALPAPPAAAAGGTTPRSDVERRLAAIWCEVLGVETVGVESDFFELGGHSLMAMRAVSRIRAVFETELALRSFFEAPTIAGLAAALERAGPPGGAGAAAIGPIEPAGRAGEIPLSHAQQRLWFVSQLDPDSSAYNVASAVRLRGRLDIPALERSLREVAARHEALRTRFGTSSDGRGIQWVDEAAGLQFRIADLHALADPVRAAEVDRWAAAEAQRPFDLARGPLLRATLLRVGPEETVALLSMHHIVSDGWSTRVLVRELSALYRAFSEGRPSPLPALRIQYPDFAVWQRSWLDGAVLDAQLDYWRQQLAAPLATLELPTDRARSAATDGGANPARARAMALSPELLERVVALGRSEDATLFMVLLGAFVVVLHASARQDDVVVGTDVANRNRDELEELIGFFVNQLVLRCDCSGQPSFRELLARLRSVVLDAVAHQDLPFDQLVQALNPDRTGNRTPLFQVKLVLQEGHSQTLRLGDVALEFIDREVREAKFDVLVNLWTTEDGLRGSWEYAEALFDAASIDWWVERFEAVLRSVADDPGVSVAELVAGQHAAERARSEARGRALRETTRGLLGKARRRSVGPGETS